MRQDATHLSLKRASCPRWLWGITLLLGCSSFIGWAQDANAQARCYSLFSKRAFVQAANCFETEAKKMGAAPQGTRRLKKGRMLRNAALCLDRAAKRSNATRAAGLRIRAMGVLSRYLKQKLYPDGSTRAATRKLLGKLRRQIGYATLTIVTNQPNAKVCITGTDFRQCKTSAYWNIRLLPKNYQIEVTYPLSPPVTKRRSFKAIPRTQRTLVFSPPVNRKGLLSVVTGDPKATIILKGGKLKTPLTQTGGLWTKELAPGTYELMVIYPNVAPLKKRFVIKQGQPSAQVFTKPGPPVLVINTTPINAQVFINGRYMGNTGIRLKLTPGKTKVELKRGCYQLVSRTLNLKANTEEYLSVILKRDPAYVAWRSSKKTGGSSVLGWVLVGGGVALAGLGGAMQGLAGMRYNEGLQVRPLNFQEYQRLATENNAFGATAIGGFVAGGALLTIGIVSLAMARPKSRYDVPCQIRLKDED